MTHASLPLALTQGDPAGIGPDIAIAAWAKRRCNVGCNDSLGRLRLRLRRIAVHNQEVEAPQPILVRGLLDLVLSESFTREPPDAAAYADEMKGALSRSSNDRSPSGWPMV